MDPENRRALEPLSSEGKITNEERVAARGCFIRKDFQTPREGIIQVAVETPVRDRIATSL
jgi:hypothetical protein